MKDKICTCGCEERFHSKANKRCIGCAAQRVILPCQKFEQNNHYTQDLNSLIYKEKEKSGVKYVKAH